MRFALVAGSAAILVAVGVFACSEDPKASDGEKVPVEATPGDDDDNGTSSSGSNSSNSSSSSSSGASSGSSGASSGSSGASSGSSGTTSSGGTSSGGTSSGGTSTSGGPIVDSGAPVDGGNAGSLCLEASVKEAEPNDTAAQAVPGKEFTFCGRIGTGTDVDQMSFTLPAGATNIQFGQSNTNGTAFKVEPTFDGTPFVFNAPPSFNSSTAHTYVFKLSSANATAYDYRITVKITAP